jgi:hypothetical protein
MSIHGMSTRTETLLFLAWAARVGVRERLIQLHEARPYDDGARERVLRGAITFSQPPVFEEDSLYGPVYKALFDYRMSRVEFQLVDWALRGYNAVYLKELEAAPPESDASTPETSLLWQSITDDERLFHRVKRIGRDENSTVRKAANALRLHFTFHLPLLMRTPESSFLYQEFIAMSLSRVNWVELAALVLDIPYQQGETLPPEEEAGDDEAMQVALLKEMLWRSYADLGELSQSPLLSRKVRDLALSLAEACSNAHGELCRQEEPHSINGQHTSL